MVGCCGLEWAGCCGPGCFGPERVVACCELEIAG